uniref:tRNA (guanine(37)-N1)-methyltransferase n=1 Tax=Denticeps clupeoides TaxID=299321 RepID=A0AAY4CEK0_9TELE
SLCSLQSSLKPHPLCARSSSSPGATAGMSEQNTPSSDQALYQAPPSVRGMTVLDREAFTQTVTVPALLVPTGLVNRALKSLKKLTLQRPGVKRVVEEEGCGETHKLVLLDPRVSSLDAIAGTGLQDLGVASEIRHFALRLTYDNLRSEEVLRAVLPDGHDVTSGFSRVGHIAHMNLRDHQLPYRNLIGQVIMDKNPGVTCVVNKTNSIDSTYRHFSMELLAGEDNMVAKVRENGLLYEFDFSRVYWNPRLSTEHERIVSQLRREDVVVDVFAGVGPFAVPAARRGCAVFANDLNPESFRWLQHNSRINKVTDKVTAFNLDGRDFIRGPVRDLLPDLLRAKTSVHVVMNLPALAIDFLDSFRGLLAHEPGVGVACEGTLPRVHCYSFSKDDAPQRDVVRRAAASLGAELDGVCSVHMVRNVAPNKEMLCVSFTLPKEVVFSDTHPSSGEKHTHFLRFTLYHTIFIYKAL